MTGTRSHAALQVSQDSLWLVFQCHSLSLPDTHTHTRSQFHSPCHPPVSLALSRSRFFPPPPPGQMRSPESPLAYLIKSNLAEWSQQGQQEEAGRRLTLLKALSSLTAFSFRFTAFQ